MPNLPPWYVGRHQTEVDSDQEESTTNIVSEDYADLTPTSPERRIARAITEKAKKGLTLGQIANDYGLSLKAFSQREDVKNLLKKLIETSSLPAELRKEMVRSGLNEIFLRTARSDKPSDVKLALEAARQIGSDPEVGLNAQPAPLTVIPLDTLRSILDKVEDLPGVENSLPILEADFKDLPKEPLEKENTCP